MLVNTLTATVVIMSLIIFINMYFIFQIHKKYSLLKTRTNILSHDIRSSLVMFNLTLGSLKELAMTKKDNKESTISLNDLPILIDVLDEAERSMFRSINQWNV
ncbi:MAG: hypothetical protein M1365_15895 [Actinobacteria bacterium]|nr:hypothetical protein [Actinomycetota bacterium]